MYKRYKKEFDYSYTYGMAITIELLLNKIDFVEVIYIHSKIIKNSNYDLLVNLCINNKIKIIEEDKIFDMLSSKENYFVIGCFKKYKEYVNIQKSNIVLVNISNAGNFGSIIRSCKGFSIEDIIIIGNSVDKFNPNVIRASMGAIFNVTVNYFETFNQYREIFSNHNIYSFFLGTENYLDSIRFLSPFSLIFGSESNGLPEEYKKYGKVVSINHSKDIDSLNLSNAVSIALYEASKNVQRNVFTSHNKR